MPEVTSRTTDPARDDRAARMLRWLPSPLALFVIGLGGVLFSITLAKGVQDPDYFWHVTTGGIIANTGSIPTTDPFSFTWQGQPWTLHEWLSELVMHGLITYAGETLTLAVFGLLPAVIFALMAAVLAARGVGPLAFGCAGVVSAFVLVPYLTLRPQAISWLLIVALIGLLLSLRPGNPGRVLLLLIPLFVLWANLHGLWVIGLGVVAAYALFTVIGRTPMSAAKGWMALGAFGAVAATAFTPAGLPGILYPLRYVNAGDWGLANIQEWQSPDFHDPAHLALLGLIILVGLNGGRATPGWLVLLSWTGIAMSLIALRNAPVAAVMAMPTLALGLQDRLGKWRARPVNRGPSVQLARRVMESALVAVVVVAAVVITLPRSPGADPDPNRFPVAGVEQLLSVRPAARTFAEYGWGGYVISQLYPHGGRVFVDGRNDMYDEAILESYSAIRAAEEDWRTQLDRWNVEAILLPPSAPLVRGFAQDAGWCEAYSDEEQVLLLRSGCPAG